MNVFRKSAKPVRRPIGKLYVAEPLERRRLLSTFVVSNAADAGAGSFRQAILDANAAAGGDQITFGSAAFNAPQTISLLSALPSSTGTLSIFGSGAQNLVIRRSPTAAGNFRILSSPGTPLTVQDLTIFGGTDGGISIGGAGSLLSLDRVVVSGNSTSNPGGGISVGDGAFLSLKNSTVSGNTAAGPGGGIYFFQNGSLLMENSTVSGNTSTSGNGGGGVYFFGIPSASPPIGFTPGTLVVRNSTIANNAATAGPGGGLRNAQFSGILHLQNSTVTRNTSGGVGGGIQAEGGGNVTLSNSIVSGNTNAVAPDISSAGPVDAFFSAIGSNAGFVFTNQAQNLPFAANLDLSPLGNFGGPTQTILLGINSAAIDAGSVGQVFGMTTDQRGAGFTRTSGANPDIGAAEAQNYRFVTVSNDSGAGSLRQAILDSNASPAFDTIYFTPNFQTISLLSALPTITGSVSLIGTGSGRLNVTRAARAPDFRIFNSTASTLNLIGMTLTGGKDVDGGGLSVSGTNPNVTLDGVAISGGSGGFGGGVCVSSNGFLTVRNSTIWGNSGGNGGGIAFFNAGSLVLENSTISGNSASGASGGLYFFGAAAANPPLGFTPSALVVRNATIANNASSNLGGGIGLLSFGGTLVVQNSTIARNAAGALGGGIRAAGGASAVTLAHTIISGNSSGDASSPDISSQNAVRANFSAIGSNAGFTLSGTSGNNLAFGADLKLSPLGNFGGPTQTIVPGIDSPVGNAGDDSFIPTGSTTDQRGAGFPRVSGARVDIGAAEAQNVILVDNANDSGAGSLRQAILTANASPAFDTILFHPILFASPQTIVLQSALPTITGQLTIFGPGKDLLTVRRNPFGAGNFRVFDSAASTLNLFGMTISDGTQGSDNLGGGALQSEAAAANITLDSVLVTGNRVEVNTGGIDILDGFLTVRNSTISQNTGPGAGAISIEGSASLVLENSTLSGNVSSFLSAGVHFLGTAAANPPIGFTPSTLVIRNSTIANNNCEQFGAGGIDLGGSALLLVQNSTIAGNSTHDAGRAGGIRAQGPNATIRLVNSVVSDNTNSGAGAPDVSSTTPVNANFSAIGNNFGFTLSGSSGNNLPFGTNLLLGPLANNGGSTQTIKPQPYSPLIGAGTNTLVPPGMAFDQRGVGFPRLIGASVDIGAVESRDPIFVTSANDAGAGTLRDAIAQANANPGDDAITFGGAAFSSPQTISLLTQLPDITDSLTIAGNTTAQNLIIRRDPAATTNFRVIRSRAPSLSISALTISGGNPLSGGGGGGIQVSGIGLTLALDGVIVARNSAAASEGGGVFVSGNSFLSLRNSSVTDNLSANAGSAISLSFGGSLLMENSTVSGNTGTGNGRGGAVHMAGTPSGSPPPGFIPSANVIRNSTIAENVHRGPGAAIGGDVGAGTLLVQNSTITRNVSTDDSGDRSGGISLDGGTLTLTNSIVSGNRNTDASDIFSTGTVNANFSAIGSSAGFTLSGSSGNNRAFGTNLRLSPLGNFGGPTQTIIPDLSSELANVGSNALVPAGLATDQRGFPRIVFGTVDIGAVEIGGSPFVRNANDSGAGSLREAILDANASPDFDTIAFDPNFFSTPRTISLLTALPTLTGEVTLFGPGKDLLTVRRDPGAATNFRIFDSTATTLNLFGMTVTGANIADNGGGLRVQVAANVTLDSVVFTGNAVQNVAGGGICLLSGGFITIRNSTISNNVAGGAGGIGIFGGGSLVLENSTLSGNHAVDTGGLYFSGAASANPPLGFAPSTLTVRNSTVANNDTSVITGGGIRARNFAGTLLVQDSTITGNTSPSGTAGGISVSGAQSTLTVANSIVSGNTASAAPDITSANPVNVNFSAIGNNTGFTFSASSGNNVAPNTDLQLGPLTSNGGPTQTRLPQTGSPLINAGSNALIPPGTAFDQRGVGFARVVGTSVDIGAVETGNVIPAPNPAGTTDLIPTDDTGASNTDNVTRVNAGLRFTGSVQPGQFARLFRDGVLVGGPVTPAGIGTVAFTDAGPIPDGAHSYTLTAADSDTGPQSAPSAALTVTIDTIAPAVSAPDLDPGSDLGASSTDNVTNDNTPTFNGTAEVNSTVRILSDGTPVGTAIVLAGGIYSITTTPLADGTRAITATATDLAGNVSTSTPLNVTIDTARPALNPGSGFQFNFDLFGPADQSVRLQFDTSLGAVNTATVPVTVTNITTNSTIASNKFSIDVLGNGITYRFNPTAGNDRFPSGNYTFLVPAGLVSDAAGNTNLATTQSFFFLDGDVNHNRSVGPEDFNLLASNFGRTGRRFGEGDLDYDGTVGPGDFNILASNFGKSLPAPAPLTAGGARQQSTPPFSPAAAAPLKPARRPTSRPTVAVLTPEPAGSDRRP